MKIQHILKSALISMLLLLFLVAYKSTALEAETKPASKECCLEPKKCTEVPAATGRSESIIWESFSDNLLSVHL